MTIAAYGFIVVSCVFYGAARKPARLSAPLRVHPANDLAPAKRLAKAAE
jgi:hypothetical protein